MDCYVIGYVIGKGMECVYLIKVLWKDLGGGGDGWWFETD